MKSWNQKPLAIIGFGAQASAWALNYRDSGHTVTIILREGSSSVKKAVDLGFQVTYFDSSKLKDIAIFCLLTPDHSHTQIIEQLQQVIKPNSTLVYAHGYSLTDKGFAIKYPQFQHLLLAPKAIASEVRFRYERKQNIMAAYSLELSPQWDKPAVEDFASQFGFKKLIATSFEEETNADLFSEQSLLCSLIPYGALHCYNKLRSKGVNKELAFIECWMEVLLIAKAMVEHGPKGLFELISPNALIGGEKALTYLFNKDFDQKLDRIMEEIWNGSFYNHVDESNYPELKEKVLTYWKEQEIQEVYETLKNDL